MTEPKAYGGPLDLEALAADHRQPLVRDLARDLLAAQAELAVERQTGGPCSICAGSGKLLTDERCGICSGTGHAHEERHGLRAEALRLERATAITGDPPSPYDHAYLSVRLSPEQIAAVNEAAQACGTEPLTWLRTVALAHCGIGSANVLARQLDAVRGRRSRP